MKPIVSKAQIRKELEDQIQAFLVDGGSVKNIPRGESGYSNNLNPFSQAREDSPPQARTPVDDAVKALEQRKHNKTKTTSNTVKKGPHKKLITDDFGEPVRWVWVDNDK